MDLQAQSPFFARLPAEIRIAIEIEYLTSYLAANASCYYTVQPCSAPLSPLSRCCKRLAREMAGHGFAIWFIGGPGSGWLRHKQAMTVEGRFDWCSVRRLRCLNEMDHPDLFSPEAFARSLDGLPNLVELEFDWNPRMSIIHRPNNAELMRSIRKHDRLRTIRLRGNVPRVLSEAKRDNALPGKAIVVEPLIMWPPIDPDEEERVEMERARTRQRLKRSLEQKIDQQLKWADEKEKRRQRTRGWLRCLYLCCFCCCCHCCGELDF